MINKKERMRKKIMKANNVKRVLTTILAATLAATSVTACGSGSSNISAEAAGNSNDNANAASLAALQAIAGFIKLTIVCSSAESVWLLYLVNKSLKKYVPIIFLTQFSAFTVIQGATSDASIFLVIGVFFSSHFICNNFCLS